VSDQLDGMRLRYGFWIIIIGFGLVAFITLVSIFRWSEVSSVATVVGAVSSLVGTVVGAFFGVRSSPVDAAARVRQPAAIGDGPIESLLASRVSHRAP